MEIIAHRGASGTHPENTMPAFRQAWADGADGVELDVQRTQDGQFVVFHDDDGYRLTGNPYKIADCTWAECVKWDVGLWKGTKFRNTRLPLLTDVLNETPRESLVLIELKFSDASIVSELSQLLRDYAALNLAIVTFNTGLARACVRDVKGVPVFLNAKPKAGEELVSLIEGAVHHGFAGLSMKWSSGIDDRAVKSVKDAGLRAAAWTINQVQEARRAKESGIDMLMTDWPGKMKSL